LFDAVIIPSQLLAFLLFDGQDGTILIGRGGMAGELGRNMNIGLVQSGGSSEDLGIGEGLPIWSVKIVDLLCGGHKYNYSCIYI
jgi:hypothetical protein